MRRVTALLWIFLLCLICLSACGTTEPPPQENSVPPTEGSQPPAPETPTAEAESRQLTSIDHLTLELVVAWEDGDRLLSALNDLSQLLRDSLLERDYQVDDVTITISTAGGFTSDALEMGGVDLALLPAVDYVTCDETARAALISDEDICTTVMAVTGLREDLDESFCNALTAALLDTESGKSFLDTYQPGISCVPATEKAIQAVRDWVAAQEPAAHGGN